MVKKDKRSLGKFFHKAKGIKCSHTKRQASIDITKECGEGKFFTQNYLGKESIVLKACACKMVIYNIDTTIL